MNGIFRYYCQPIRIVVTDRAGIGILVAVPGARLPGLRGQRLPRQPHPRPGVVETDAELIQAQVFIPLLAREGVVVVRVCPVALGREQLAVCIITVVVGALALMCIISLTPGLLLAPSAPRIKR